ncbi:cytochrome P450, partial [Cytidiella melzeri]
TMSTPIPVPPYLPVIGHVVQMDLETPLKTIRGWGEAHGEIFQVYVLGNTQVWVTSAELCGEVSDDQRFSKLISGPLEELRALVGDSLFTATKDEPNWGIAHRLLQPSFKTSEVKNMFPDMLDIASQLILKWDRFGPEYRIDVCEDFTRLALDTLALCSMSYRYNSFYRDENHPFVQAMFDFLTQASQRSRRPKILADYIYKRSYDKWQEDMKCMADLAQSILDKRRAHPIDKPDLLNVMLLNKDTKTGQNLSDLSIIQNLITFLVAGHETTAGLLGFCLFFLIKHPDAMRKAQAEVDEVLGDQQIQAEDMAKFTYITESLRLGPTIPARQVYSREDTTLCNGKYFLPKGQKVLIHIEQVHRDKTVWGEDADEFKPERMLDGKFEALPPGAWQPFGFGSRVCIGRPFAMQEATIAVAMILQKFDCHLADPDYELDIVQRLTTKPKDLYVHAVPRARKLFD